MFHGTWMSRTYAKAKNHLVKLVPEARDPSWVESMTSESRAAVKTAAEEALAKGGINSDGELAALADTLSDAGLHDEARAVVRARGKAYVLTARRSSLDWLRRKFEAGHVDEGNLALVRARQLEPAEVKYRAEMSYRSEASRVATSSPAGGASTSHARRRSRGRCHLPDRALGFSRPQRPRSRKKR